MNKKLLRNDILLIALLILIILLVSVFLYSKSDSTAISVIHNNKTVKVMSLKADAQYRIPDTEVTVCVKDGKAFIYNSDCPDKLCMNMNPIAINSPENYCIVCLPNKVAIVKNGKGIESEADIIAG